MTIKDSAAVTETGSGREINEDAVLVLREPALAAVASGMGGPGAGNVAASMAMVHLQQAAPELARKARAVDQQRTTESRLAAGRALERVLLAIHAEISQTATRSDKPEMMTTLVAAMVTGDHAAIAHVGAARAYLYRQGRLRTLTEDHTLAMLRLRQGRMSPAEFRTSPLRTQVYQALGSGPDVDVDVAEVAVADDDLLLLCSDGVHTHLDKQTLVACLELPDAEQAATELVRAAKAAGAGDDTSAVVLRIGAQADSALLDDISLVLQETFLFSGLSEAERTVVTPYLDHRWLDAGHVLFREGDRGDAFYVVVDGTVRITRDGTHLVDVATGGSFGELCLARPVPRSATVTALTQTLVFGLARQRFHEITQRKPALGARIAMAALDQLGDRLRDLTERLATVEALANHELGLQGLELADAISLAARGQFEKG